MRYLGCFGDLFYLYSPCWSVSRSTLYTIICFFFFYNRIDRKKFENLQPQEVSPDSSFYSTVKIDLMDKDSAFLETTNWRQPLSLRFVCVIGFGTSSFFRKLIPSLFLLGQPLCYSSKIVISISQAPSILQYAYCF